MSFLATDTIVVLLYALAVATTISWLRGRQKDTIPPLIGSNGAISSYKAAYQLLHNAADIVLQGYLRNPDGVFRVPSLYQWDYVANGKKRIGEVSSASEDVLSFKHGVEETLQASYMTGREVADDSYHHHTVRTTLTRNLGRCFPEVRDEIMCAFDDVLKVKSEDWETFTALPSIMQVVARTSNRLFCGLPLCRNQEYLNFGITFTIAVFLRGQIIRMFPNFLRPIVGRLISPRKQGLRQVLRFLGPVIRERLAKEDELGPDWPDKPNDLISWLIQDAAPEKKRDVSGIALRVLLTNSAAIHTSTMALVDALFDLTTYPSHIQPMREEVERVIRKEGWTKSALANMHKVDSFIRESQRLNGAQSIAMTRKVVAKEGFRFSDGTVIPFGSFVGVSGRPVQHDPVNYDHPDVFDGFRFSRMREQQSREAGEKGIFKNHMVSTAPEHLVFGHGTHACPGRFFAATELKAMLAHMLVAYDIKSDNEGVRPPEYTFGQMRSPNPTARLWVRRRQ
ncbi:cytochrome P450 [Mycena vulgaris]|nr:cytochrome P450 [Mycena vulgaris]